MKKIICFLFSLSLFTVGISYDVYSSAYGYQIEREPCNSGNGSFYVCRPMDHIGCSVAAQNLYEGYGNASIQ